MRRHWSYLKAVLRHKYFVFVEGLWLGVPLHRLILHDWDKFLIWNWFPYAEQFYESNGRRRLNAGESPAFRYAWNRHQKLNDHHYQFWMLKEDSGAMIPLAMSDNARKEMLADWRGAGRAYGDDHIVGWYTKRRGMFMEVLHIETRLWIEHQLGIYDGQ